MPLTYSRLFKPEKVTEAFFTKIGQVLLADITIKIFF
jgi:hypothetical protein